MNIRLNNFLLGIILFTLAAGNLFFIERYFVNRGQMDEVRQYIADRKQSREILNFLKLFTAKVIKAEGEVGFEDRLILENAVRNLDDAELLDQWQKFVNSKTSEEAQENLKELLDMLVTRIEL